MKIALFKVHDNDPLSFLIKARTRGQYSHAAVVVDEASFTIIEAYYPHVRKRVLSPDEIRNIDFFEVQGITPEQETKVVAYCEAAVAAMTDYSITDLFRFLAPVRALLGEPTDDGSLNIPKFCSMFVFDAMLSAGITLLNAHSYEVDPVHLTWSTLLLRWTPPGKAP